MEKRRVGEGFVGKRRRRGLTAVLAAPAFALALGACSVTGGTSRIVVSLEPIPLGAELRPVRLASLEREKEGMQLLAVGVYEWGKFDDRDQANLARSIEDTLKAAVSRRGPASGAAIDVHVMIRTHFVAASNREAAVIAGVDWCAVDADRRVVFQDAFYAAYACGNLPKVCTLGGAKDAVNGAIVKRIGEDALALAAGARPGGRTVDRTYSSFEEAAATLPQTLMSTLTEGVETAPLGVVETPLTEPARVLPERARMGERIDWTQRLERAR